MGQRADQDQAENHVDDHGSPPNEDRGQCIVKGVEGAGDNLQHGVGEKAQGVELQGPDHGLGGALLKSPPLKEQLDDGITQNKEPHAGRDGQIQDGTQSGREGASHLGHLPFGCQLGKGRKGRRGHGLGEDALGQQHQQPGEIQGGQTPIGQARSQNGVDQKVELHHSQTQHTGRHQSSHLPHTGISQVQNGGIAHASFDQTGYLDGQMKQRAQDDPHGQAMNAQ